MEAARRGDVLHFAGLPADQVAPLLRQRDEDRRSLLHTAAASGSLELVQWLADHGAASAVNDADDEVGAARLACMSVTCERVGVHANMPALVLRITCGRAPLICAPWVIFLRS